MSTFKNLNIIPPVLKALEEKKYANPTFIQQEAIPHLLSKRDLLGCAQTGTGKTAAFSIPILQMLHSDNEHKGVNKKIKALIISPTRELAIQIGESISDYGKYTSSKHTVIYGGVSQHTQVAELKKGVDILIATPGRLKDLTLQGYIHLNAVEIFVLDEADRMLDMGFINDIKFVLNKVPKNKQSVFFTATLSPTIRNLAESILISPVSIEAKTDSTKRNIEQSVYHVNKKNKKKLLFHLFEDLSPSNVLIFTKTKHGADRLAIELNKSGIKSDSLHGGKSQNARNRALSNFKTNKNNVLVVTDIAARGIDIDKLAYVINYDIPNEVATYIHRIGRTGRAGAKGTAISFCDSEENSDFTKINKFVSNAILEIKDHPFTSNHNSNNLTSEINESERTKKKINNWLRDRRITKHRNPGKRKSN